MPFSGTSFASLRPIALVNTASSRPNLAAKAPSAPPSAMLSRFSPPYACASFAASFAFSSTHQSLLILEEQLRKQHS